MLLKIFILVSIGFCFPANVFADYPTVKKMKEFFEKNKKCNLAIGIHNSGPADKGPLEEHKLWNLVLCVSDLTINPGTINEEIGCGLATYDVFNDTLSTTFTRSKHGFLLEDPKKTNGKSFPLVSNTKCSDSGLEKLMDVFPGASLGGKTVGEGITMGVEQGRTEKIFLYASEPRFKDIWELEKSKLKVLVKKPKNKKAK